MPRCSLCSLLQFQRVYVPPKHLFVSNFLIASFDRCFFLDLYPCFLNGTNLSVMPEISSFKQVQHSVAILFFSKILQSIFARYILISLYLPLLKFLLHCFLYVFPALTFFIKMDLIVITGAPRFVYFNIVN